MSEIGIKVKSKKEKSAVVTAIKSLDSEAFLDEDHGLYFWMTTSVDPFDIEKIPNVDYVLRIYRGQNRPCTCGSGRPCFSLEDARGIHCSMVCEKCEKEVKSRYRPEIFEDGDYEADEQIEPEDY